jgi:hypothetical protein
MASDILVPSQEELSRLIQAFVKISNMQGRMRVLDMAEKYAKERARAHAHREQVSDAA